MDDKNASPEAPKASTSGPVDAAEAVLTMNEPEPGITTDGASTQGPSATPAPDVRAEIKDKAGAVFNPAVHEADAGVPRLTVDGLFRRKRGKGAAAYGASKPAPAAVKSTVGALPGQQAGAGPAPAGTGPGAGAGAAADACTPPPKPDEPTPGQAATAEAIVVLVGILGAVVTGQATLKEYPDTADARFTKDEEKELNAAWLDYCHRQNIDALPPLAVPVLKTAKYGLRVSHAKQSESRLSAAWDWLRGKLGAKIEAPKA